MKSNCRFRRFLILMLFALSQMALSQSLPKTSGEKEEPAVTEDYLGRHTPRGTVSGYIKAIADQDYQRASQFLDLTRKQSGRKSRIRTVENFQRLLDRDGDIMTDSWISNKPEGQTDDELETGIDIVGNLTKPDGTIDLYVQNTGTEAAPVWKFSQKTVSDLLSIRDNQKMLLDRVMPESLQERRIGGVPLGHWLALIVLIVVSYLASWIVVSIVASVLMFIWTKTKLENFKLFVEALNLPVRLYFAVWIFVFLSQQIGISIIIRQKFSSVTIVIGIIAILILMWRFTDYLGTYSQKRFTTMNRASAISVTLFLKRMFKSAIVIFGGIAILGSLGVDVTTGLAALGIGGIALALGAQKTVENFVGSVTLLADQPMRVGDFCRIGDISGTVEQIGMRSTKLRTSQRSVVTIPNGDLAGNRIENLQQRDRYYFDPIFFLRLDTSPDQIRFLLVELRKILLAHPSVYPAGLKVRFTDVLQEGYKIELNAYIEAPDLDTFQEAQEDILLLMMDVIDRSGTALSMPSRTLFMARDVAKSEEKKIETQETVRKWVENNELELPKSTPEQVEKLRGSLPYPPKGSVLHEKDKPIL